MVDYTTKTEGGSGIGLYLAGGVVVLVLLYAIFAGGGATTDGDPAAALAGEETLAPAAEPALDGTATTTAN